jgi:uncharacterized membrane protein
MAGERVATPDDRVRFGREEVEFGRALAFFDATFAIATTLLAATLNPGPRGWSSWSDLLEAIDGPFIAFAISFTVIASYWWANHRFVASLRVLSSRLVVGTIVLLAFVVVLPITTEGLGEDLGSAEVTTVVYAVNVTLVSSMEWVLYRIAVADDLFVVRPSRGAQFASTVGQLIPPFVFLVSIPIALLGAPVASRGLWISLVVISPVVGRWANRRMAAASAPDAR